MQSKETLLHVINLPLNCAQEEEGRQMADMVIKGLLLAIRESLVQNVGESFADMETTIQKASERIAVHQDGIGSFIDAMFWLQSNEVCNNHGRIFAHLTADIGRMLADEIVNSEDFESHNPVTSERHHQTH
jgi:hypothetical protein